MVVCTNISSHLVSYISLCGTSAIFTEFPRDFLKLYIRKFDRIAVSDIDIFNHREIGFSLFVLDVFSFSNERRFAGQEYVLPVIYRNLIAR